MYRGYHRGMGRAHGLGRIKHSDGDSYCGEWLHGRAHGCGVYRFQDGAACYEGQFRCDQREGLGVESWVDGSGDLGGKVGRLGVGVKELVV